MEIQNLQELFQESHELAFSEERNRCQLVNIHREHINLTNFAENFQQMWTKQYYNT